MEEPEGLLIYPKGGRAGLCGYRSGSILLVPMGLPVGPLRPALPQGAGQACSTADCLPLPAGLAPCLVPPNSRPQPRPSEQPLFPSGPTPSPLPTAPPWLGTGSLGR